MRGLGSGISQRGRYAVQSLSTVASILLVALLAFFASFYTVYQRTSAELERDIIAESSQSMVLSAQEVSSSFAREWQLLTESSFVADVRGLLQDCEGSARYSRLSSLNKLLNRRFASDMPFHSVAIYGMGREEDFFCTQRFVSDDFRADYEAGLFCFDGMSYDAFKETIRSCSAHRVDRRTFVSGELTYTYDSSYSSHAGYYVYRYPNADAGTQLYALLQIDLNGLRNVLSLFRYAGDFFMIEGAGQVLFTTDPDVSLHQVKGSLYADAATDVHYLRTVIDNLGFTCYLSIDSHALYESIAHFNRLLHLLSYVFCALTVFTVGLLFLRWHYPVIRVAERIAPNGMKYNPIASIDLHISTLTQQNDEKARRIELLEPAAKSDLLRRFYLGRPLNEHERDTLCALLPHGEEGAFRCLLLGSLSPAADRPVLTSLLDVLHAHFQALCAPDVIDGQMAVLVPMEPADDPTEFLPQLQTLLAGFNAEYPALCAIGASDVYIGYSSVPQAYLEARAGWTDALNWQNPSVVFTGASDPAAVCYRLSYSQLEDLYHALKSGSAEHALALFDEAVAENFPLDSGLHLRRQFCQQFFADIDGVLTRLAVKHDILLVLDSLQNTRQLAFRQRLAELRCALLECAELIASQAGENNLSSQIQAFCTSHYSDADFSLTAVAQNFHLSESNLSKFFKAHTGITFSSYIENLRISNAEQLLIEGRLSVKSIAAAVGYASTATFYNAFRRTHNCTPTQWLEMRAEYADAAQSAAR